MRRPDFSPDWHPDFLHAYEFDRLEVFGDVNPRSGHELGYSRFYRERFTRTVRTVTHVAPKGGSVLDIAGAQGNFSLALAEKGYRVTWNDLRAHFIDYVESKRERGSTIEYCPGNAFELAFPHPFDVVLATEIIEHVAHPDRFLATLASLVKPNGAIVLTTPNGAYFRNPLPRFSDCPNPEQFESVQFKPDADGHIFLLHPDEMYTLAAKAGLVVERVSLFANPLTRGALRLDRVLPLIPEGLVHLTERITASRGGTTFDRFNMQMLAVIRRPSVPVSPPHRSQHTAPARQQAVQGSTSVTQGVDR